MRLAAVLALSGLLSACSVQQNSIVNTFASDGFTCTHASTRDAEVTTVVTLCRDDRDSGKVALANASTVPSAAWTDIVSALVNAGVLVAAPILVAL